ncbi:hypothetical protein EV368DRAFT_66561, partial [Lentinula lateritia]
MSVTVQGHPCVAFKDSSSYYSVLAGGYARSNGLGDWRNTCLTLSVDIRLHNFAFTLRVNFILEDDEDIRDLHRECIVRTWLFTKGPMTITLSATTGEMNILSHEAAYCLFPLMTLVQNRTMLIHLQSPMERSENLAIRKQTNRGLEVVHRPSALLCANITSSLSFLSTRHIGDEHCYIVPFDNTADNTRRPDFLDCHSWSMAYTRRYNLFLTEIFKPTTPTRAFIVSPEDRALIMARFAVIENLVSDGLLA